MIARTTTVAFQGLHTQTVDVQVHIGDGLPAFNIVGLADKAVSEAKERVRSALSAVGVSLPPKRITINLSPADMVKEGSHYDLPIALGLLSAMGVLDGDTIGDYVMMGELALDGTLVRVNGILPASVHANALDKAFICPEQCANEALWAGDSIQVLAPQTLGTLLNHLRGIQDLPVPKQKPLHMEQDYIQCISDIRGQESAKRALEVCASGGHNLLMMGPPGSGKSMLAERIPSILPPLNSSEALDVSIIYSLNGELGESGLITTRPFRSPHFGASTPALVGGGAKAKPGEISLAHNGVLFLDEMPEFSRMTLESLRQPIESKVVTVARANAHITYPANFQLIGAMNPCRCGDVDGVTEFCKRGEKCALDYQAKISGPMYDRFDVFINVPAVKVEDLSLPKSKTTSEIMRHRVCETRAFTQTRLQQCGILNVYTNADVSVADLEKSVRLSEDCVTLIQTASQKLKLTARSYHRVLKVARTLADMEFCDNVENHHMLEALSYRRGAG